MDSIRESKKGLKSETTRKEESTKTGCISDDEDGLENQRLCVNCGKEFKTKFEFQTCCRECELDRSSVSWGRKYWKPRLNELLGTFSEKVREEYLR